MKKKWLFPLLISALPTLSLAWVTYSLAAQEEVRNIAKGIAIVGLIGTVSGFAAGWNARRNSNEKPLTGQYHP